MAARRLVSLALACVVVIALAGPAAAGIALEVNVAAARKSISPDIYGLHYTDEAFAREIGLPVRRWGGNDTTRYNWQIDLSNNGYDYYFENNKTRDLSVDQFVERDRRTGSRTIVTVPLTGWVARNDPDACGFSLDRYAYVPLPYPFDANPPTDPFRPQCGSGIVAYVNGDPGQPVFFGPTSPTDTSQPAPPAFVSQWVTALVARFGTSAGGGVRYYALDNEPDLWNSTHRDIHPVALGYDELRQRGIDYATAVKAADPTALVLGPVSFGWSGYFFSAADLEAGAANGFTRFPDLEAHGNVYLVPWYLGEMRAREQATGTRLLDYLDLHYYPQNGVSLRDAGDAATQALRLRSTRSLWDPTYLDESFIRDAGPDGGFVRLIPRMREWVAAYYPGTRLAITEYNWGALDHINGALAQADVLGIFGREGVDLATLFDTPFGSGLLTPQSPGAFAFRVYRNYDGLGSRFGDVSVRAVSADQAQLSVYAAQRSTDGALTVVVINKTAVAQTGDVAIAGFAGAPTAAVHRYSPANLGAIVRQADQPVAGPFSTVFPANSITLLVLFPAAGGGPSPLDAFVTGFYDEILGRLPSAGELSAWTGFLQANPTPAGASGFAHTFLDGPEYLATPVTPEGFVATLYRVFLGREPDAPGLAGWVGALLAGYDTVLPGFVGSTEFRSLLPSTQDRPAVDAVVTRLYENVLERAPAANEVRAWSDFIVATGDVLGVARGFFRSAEYNAAPRNLATHVRILYRTFLGRDPAPAETGPWVDLLQGFRVGIENSFIASPEFDFRYRSLFP